jgi:hypothetical protein
MTRRYSSPKPVRGLVERVVDSVGLIGSDLNSLGR